MPRKPAIGVDDLATLYPLVAAEADNWEPKHYFAKSNKKMPWICKSGHSYDAMIISRTSGGSGCPYCAGNLPIPGETDLQTLHPEIASEAYGWDPVTVKPGSSKKLNWKCSKGHVYSSTPYLRKKLATR